MHQRGQTTAEYMGLLVVVAAIIAALWTIGLGGLLGDAVKHGVCQVVEEYDAQCHTASDADQAQRPSSPSAGAPAVGPETNTGAPAINLNTAERGATRAQTTFAAYGGALAGQGFGPSSAGPAPEVPGPPEPPPAPPGNLDGSGEFDSVNPGFFGTLKNEFFETTAHRGADIFEGSGREDAARHMRHFLGASGDPLEVEPARMLRDIEFFRADERDERDDMVREIQEEAARREDGDPFSFTVGDRDWEVIPSDPGVQGGNWFYALGGFSFTHTASVQVTPRATQGAPPRVEIDYQTHVFDRYNWDIGKGVDIGPVPVSDEDLQDLHRAGLAQDFPVYGSTDTETVTVDADPDAGSAAPPDDPPDPTPEAPEGEGGRGDPQRERGRD